MDKIERDALVKLMQGKGLTSADMAMIRPDLYKEIRLEELLLTEEVILWQQCELTEQVIEFKKLSEPEIVKGKGHSGPKNPMDCPLCGKETHRCSWAQVKIDGIYTHVGTLSEICAKHIGLKVRVPQGKWNDETFVKTIPLSKGQLAGLRKTEEKLGWKTDEELSKEEDSNEDEVENIDI